MKSGSRQISLELLGEACAKLEEHDSSPKLSTIFSGKILLEMSSEPKSIMGKTDRKTKPSKNLS